MKKRDVITFKVDEALSEILHCLPNRSEFIRNALLTALDSVCPVCGGSGIMTPKQKEHWGHFMKTHAIKECNRCNEFHLVCRLAEEGACK